MQIAISGAGVAGPTLAYWLLRAGHEPTLIEAAPALRTGGYVIDFWGLGFDFAERMGLIPAIREAGYAIQEMRMVDGRGRTAASLSGEAMRRRLGNRFVSLPRGDLAAILNRSVEGRAEFLFGTSLAAIDQDLDKAHVTFADGRRRTFDLVIGADGLHSKVRALTFGPQDSFERPLGYYVAAVEAVGYRSRAELTYVSYPLPGRQISRFSLRGDRTLFLFVFEADRLRRAEPHDLEGRRAALEEVFADAQWEWPEIRRALGEATDLYFDRVSQILAPTWSRGRIALVGDAAGCVSLLAGEGSGLAITEAYVLAGELASCGGHYAAAFSGYEARLRAFIGEKQAAARRFTRSFAPHTAFGVWFRNRVIQALGLPGVADLFLGAQLNDRLALPEYRFER